MGILELYLPGAGEPDLRAQGSSLTLILSHVVLGESLHCWNLPLPRGSNEVATPPSQGFSRGDPGFLVWD